VASIQPGDVVSYPKTWTHWGNEATFAMTFAERDPLRHRCPNGPYSIIGPVEIVGADPGDIVECQLLALRTRDRGWNSFPLYAGALPHDLAEPYVHYFRFDDARRTTEYVPFVRSLQPTRLPTAITTDIIALKPPITIRPIRHAGPAAPSPVVVGP
jgi:acetamidase/formamidase